MTNLPSRFEVYLRYQNLRFALFLALSGAALLCAAQSKPGTRKKPAAQAAPDVLVLSNGDTLHGKFVNEMNGKITFDSAALGNISVAWGQIKELHVTERFAVLNSQMKLRGKKSMGRIPVGTLEMSRQTLTVHPAAGQAGASIPVEDAQYIMNEATLNKQVYHAPNFFAGWNGTLTAGGTVVSATQNQFTVSGAASLARVVPTVNWLNPRNRTSTDFSGSFGKITQPGYFSAGTFVPATSTKTSIYHADAERDEYFSPRFFALAQTAFDHNFGQDLALQQIYGGGIGWTAIKTPRQEIDLKATIQYEKQQFISGSASANQNLSGSTYSASYALNLKRLTFTQTVAYIPAYNQPAAYSATESNTVTFPAYKNLGFTVGTMDSYLNDPPVTLPATKRNSFQFTMGLTYGIKSKY